MYNLKIFFLNFYALCIVNNRKDIISLETIQHNNLMSHYQDTTAESVIFNGITLPS